MNEVVISLLPVIAVLLPFFGSLPVFFAGKMISRAAGNALAVIITAATFLSVLMMIPHVMGGYRLEFVLIPVSAVPVEIVFMVDHLGLVTAIFSSALWLAAVVYSVEYMAQEHAQDRYYSFLMLTLGATLGILLTKNLFALYLFFEIMALTSYVLVIHEETREALAAGLKYIFVCLGFGLCLLLAILVTYSVAGTLDLGNAGILPPGGASGMVYTILFWLFVVGFGAKAGLFPLHFWLPDAHPVAPSPASALLSGVMIGTGAYGIIRVIYDVFGISLVSELGLNAPLAVIAGAAIILGSAVAITQKEIKRMLAYSSISQIGYPVLGAALLTPAGLEGAIFHLFNHAFMKGCLFLCAGAIIYRCGIRNIDSFSGLGRRMPLTMLCFTIAAFSMIGIPPLNGFISKWILCRGALEAGTVPLMLFVGVLLLSSLMNAVYYLPIVIRAYFGDADMNADVENSDPGAWMLLPMLALALVCIISGICANTPLSVINPYVVAIFGI